MQDNKKHWVEELFSPHFTADDFLYQTFEPDQLASEKLAEKRAKTVEAIYHSVLQKTHEEEKVKRKAFLSDIIVRDYELSPPEEMRVLHDPATEQYGACRSCGKVNLSSSANNDNRCIWDGNDLNILRHEINRSQAENARLKIHLDAGNHEASELKEKNSKTVQELEDVKASLSVSKREDKCKNVLITQLQRNLPKKDAAIQGLRKDLHGKCVEANGLHKHLAEAKEEIQGLQLKNKDLERELTNLKRRQELTIATLEEKLKLKYHLEICKLHREIQTAKDETTSEKLQHARDLNALDLLRKHFSALSTNDNLHFAQLDVPPR
uniref:Uncharacterized protein n=1 Tax=Leptobrachium leishanense TaxID=445787 RepID=A0A8C5WC31_9ANUR